MKQQSISIGCYAFIILLGGIIGFVMAHSLISLVFSSIFAIVLLVCSVRIWRHDLTAYHTAMALVLCLFFFFSYRFLLTFKFAPAGIMIMISGFLFIYLVATRKRLPYPVD